VLRKGQWEAEHSCDCIERGARVKVVMESIGAGRVLREERIAVKRQCASAA